MIYLRRSSDHGDAGELIREQRRGSEAIRSALRAVDGVQDVAAVRLRWIGHRLPAEAELVVNANLSLVAAHKIATDAEHQLAHAVSRLTSATVHTDPDSHPGGHHTDLFHQRRQAPR
ncbi:cation transporter dimerization domain-containing protein [Micromonospora sp. I033]